MTEALPLRENGLPHVQRVITDHNKDGKSIISKILPEQAEWIPMGGMSEYFLGYTTRTFPTSLNPSDPLDPASIPIDIEDYTKDLDSAPGLSISSGTVLRYVDFIPNIDTPMHRTLSIDYGIVLEGEIELRLDGGETRVFRKGDVCIQRATNHAWKNVTANNGWGRMLFILIAADKLEVAGKELGEELNDIAKSHRASD